MRGLALRYAQYILEPPRHLSDDSQMSDRTADAKVWKIIHDALRLDELCGMKFQNHHRSPDGQQQLRFRTAETACDRKHCIYVNQDACKGNDDGTIKRPFCSIEKAVQHSREEIANPTETAIILENGIYTLQETLILGSLDSGLTIIGAPRTNEVVWISGGVEIPNDMHWGWDCKQNLAIRVANLTDLLAGKKVPKVASLFAPNKRLIRARFPNGDPETIQWGYLSPEKFKYSIRADEVLEWHRPPKGELPTFQLVDFQHYPPPGVPIKNDSIQAAYNMYASGKGGVCADLWGPQADSYWCSSASSGGWAEVDRECAMTGQLQIPVGMSYNRTSQVGQRLERWKNGAIAGIVHAWHSQTWAMHMFEIQFQEPGSFRFAKGGGNQGGRNWCRCDQCTYAAGWCGQHQNPPVKDDRLISGTWMIENVLSELDEPGEFYFERKTRLLYLYPNKTDSKDSGLKNLRFALLENLIQIHGASNISLVNLGFRDSALTYLGEWSAPSGGDWSLHRGGAIIIKDSTNITIKNCIFRRLDGNGVFLSRRTRHVKISGCKFEWLGENAVVLWGNTDGYDATERNFPMNTVIEYNVMRELGIFQKQSSAVAHNKAAKTVIQNNIMFNMPRAAINFNDMVGGGDVVWRNIIFNTCRESGDHGPINTWDRQAFLTDIRNGSKSFVPLRRTIAFNFIFANYGASQGVDNDDGSSWYHVNRNVFYDSDGFKMDYGGHDSSYEENIVIAYPVKRGKSSCIEFGAFLLHHGHSVHNNICILPCGGDQPIVYLATCNQSNTNLYKNMYHTLDGEVSVKCGYSDEVSPMPLEKVQQEYGLETGSTKSKIPTAKTILSWVLQTLFSAESPDEVK